MILFHGATRCFYGVLLAVVSLPAVAVAFTCETYDGENCIRWREGQTLLRSLLGNPDQLLINGTITWDQNTLFAANDWNAVNAGLRFDVTTEGPFRDPCTTVGPCAETGALDENPIFFTTSICGRSFGPDIVAQTVVCFRLDNGGIVNAPVFVNSRTPWNAYDGPLIDGTQDIRRVILHELGHVAGLGHPDDAGQNVLAIMNRFPIPIDRLQDDDINGLRFIYGGDPAPTPTPQVVKIEIGNGVSMPGGRLDVEVSLFTAGLSVAATGNDIEFDESALQLNPSGCVSEVTGKTLVASSPTSGTVRVFMQSSDGNTQIPDGPLYTCTIDIQPFALPGTYSLGNRLATAFNPQGVGYPQVVGVDGAIIVSLVPIACLGDCDGDDRVTVDEIVRMVSIALGGTSLDDCRAGDGNGDGSITVDEIVAAIEKALSGCETKGS